MNLIIFIINIIVVVTSGVLIAVMPFITRKSLLFGVRIPQAQTTHPEVQKLKRRFSLLVSIATVITTSALTLQYIFAPHWSVLMMLCAPLSLIAFQFAAYIPSWRTALRLKTDNDWSVLEKGSADTRLALSRQTFSNIPWGWYAVSMLIAVSTGLIAVKTYSQIPDPMIIHWNAAMEPDGWLKKTTLSVFVFPLAMAGVTLLIMISNLAVWRMKLQVNQYQTALSYTQHRLYRTLMSHLLGCINVIICAMMLFFTGISYELYHVSEHTLLIAIIVPTILMILVPIAFTIKVGQGGNKLNPKILPEDDTSAGLIPKSISVPTINRQDDRFWKLGLFYYNKEDPTLFIEDRFGVNAGLNYARPSAWIFVAVLAAVLIATTVLFAGICLQQLHTGS